MDIVFCTSWILAYRKPESSRPMSEVGSSGLPRLLVALAVIAVIVGALANVSASPRTVASTTLHSGEAQ
jgi:hypothetical protein